MSIPSLIFWLIFVLPLVAFFIWLMRQDKRKGATGIIVLAIIVIGGIVYTYLQSDQAKKQPVERSGSMRPHVDTAK